MHNDEISEAIVRCLQMVSGECMWYHYCFIGQEDKLAMSM